MNILFVLSILLSILTVLSPPVILGIVLNWLSTFGKKNTRAADIIITITVSVIFLIMFFIITILSLFYYRWMISL